MKKISVFKNFSDCVGNKSIYNILNDIKEGTYKSQIDKIRDLRKEGEDEQADSLKNKLLGFTTSGTFDKGRIAKNITTYSSYLVLDIDKLTETELENAVNILKVAPYTFASFRSPSGNGLKIIVKVNTKKERHKEAYKQVVAYYEEALNIDIDTSGSDVSRLCYVSYDPNCYIKENAAVFEVEEVNSTINHHKNEYEYSTNSTQSSYDIFQKCIAFTNNKLHYIVGNRNNYIHQLACNCNRNGIPKDEALTFISQSYDLNSHEIKAAVKSAYNNVEDFASFANIAHSIIYENESVSSVTQDEYLLKMPFLPCTVFNGLPSILKEGASVFSNKRERDVFLTGALPILSGCMHNVSGSYMGKIHFSNLFSFTIAPAASGKGALTFSKELGNKYHNQLIEESKALKKEYDIAFKEYEKRLANKKIDTASEEPPIQPPFKVLYIPADNSSARVIQHLEEGDEQGVFCETEADSMGNALKKEWGSYSDILRKAFHHEPISYSRKTDKEWVEIQKPKLSVALAGTPGQVQNLIKSAEDGLFSRFIFYTFKSELEWIDAGEDMNGVNLSNRFDLLSKKTLEFINFLKLENEIDFKLTTDQWRQLNKFGKETLFDLAECINEDLSSTTKRFGVILYRLCMVLTALRYFDNGESSSVFICADEDFTTALELIKVYKQHSVLMFNKLPKSGDVTEKVIQHLFDSLPFKFQRKKAIEIAENNFQIKPRTTDLYLQKLIKANYLEKIKSGFYQKLK